MHPLLIAAQTHPPKRVAVWRDHIHSQEFKDRLYVTVVAGLVLAAILLAAGYAVHEMPRWRAGELGGFDAAVLPLPTEPGEAAAPPADPGINRTTLLITSMLVEAIIFVGLGLFLRHEMKQKS